MTRAQLSLIQTGIHATDPKNNEIGRDQRRNETSVPLPRVSLLLLPLSLYPKILASISNRVILSHLTNTESSLHAACSALPIGRRDARAFSVAGARDPTPAPATKARLLLAG